jgi:hypothetical protein
MGGKPVMEALANAWSRLARNQLDTCSSKSPECLRVWLLAFANPNMMEPATYHVIIDRLLVSLVGLGKRARSTLEHWWGTLPLDQYMVIVSVLQRYVEWLVTTLDGAKVQSKAVNAAMALERLYGARELAPGSFYNAALSSHIDLVREYTQFVSSQAVFSWLRYPYLLTADAKANLVAIAFKSEMERAFLQQRVRQAGYTILTIRRDHLVEDAFAQLHALSGAELQRPLKVVFAGEMGVDEGGLTKELLFTILEKLLDPDYGMFTFNQQSGKNWFNHMSSSHVFCAASTVHYELVGMVVGLAVANGVILNVDFPPLLYSKLLGRTTFKLEHLGQIDPELARNLKALITLEGDFSDLGLTFSVEQNNLGEVITHELVANGAQTPVTERNVMQYIERYLQVFFFFFFIFSFFFFFFFLLPSSSFFFLFFFLLLLLAFLP